MLSWRNIFPVIVLIVAAGFGFTYVMPKYEEVQALREREATIEEALGTAQQIDQLITDLNADIARIPQQKQERLRRVIPETVDTPQVYTDISGVAREHNVSFSEVTFQPDSEVAERAGVLLESQADQLPEGSHYRSVPIAFSAIGTYDDLMAFLSSLEQSVQLLDVVNAEFVESELVDQSNLGPGEKEYVLTVTAATYKLKEL